MRKSSEPKEPREANSQITINELRNLNDNAKSKSSKKLGLVIDIIHCEKAKETTTETNPNTTELDPNAKKEKTKTEQAKTNKEPITAQEERKERRKVDTQEIPTGTKEKKRTQSDEEKVEQKETVLQAEETPQQPTVAVAVTEEESTESNNETKSRDTTMQTDETHQLLVTVPTTEQREKKLLKLETTEESDKRVEVAVEHQDRGPKTIQGDQRVGLFRNSIDMTSNPDNSSNDVSPRSPIPPEVVEALELLGMNFAGLEINLDNPTAIIRIIRKAFQEQARVLHPDRGGSMEDFQALNEARTAALEYFQRQTRAGSQGGLDFEPQQELLPITWQLPRAEENEKEMIELEEPAGLNLDCVRDEEPGERKGCEKSLQDSGIGGKEESPIAVDLSDEEDEKDEHGKNDRRWSEGTTDDGGPDNDEEEKYPLARNFSDERDRREGDKKYTEIADLTEDEDSRAEKEEKDEVSAPDFGDKDWENPLPPAFGSDWENPPPPDFGSDDEERDEAAPPPPDDWPESDSEPRGEKMTFKQATKLLKRAEKDTYRGCTSKRIALTRILAAIRIVGTKGMPANRDDFENLTNTLETLRRRIKVITDTIKNKSRSKFVCACESELRNSIITFGVSIMKLCEAYMELCEAREDLPYRPGKDTGIRSIFEDMIRRIDNVNSQLRGLTKSGFPARLKMIRKLVNILDEKSGAIQDLTESVWDEIANRTLESDGSGGELEEVDVEELESDTSEGEQIEY